MYPINAASPQRVAIGPVVQISDGAVQTSGVSVKVLPQGGAAAAGGGTIAYEEGIVHYVPTQAETNYASFILIAYKTGCIPATVTVVTSASGTAGYAGVDWGKVTAATSTVGLTNTTVGTVTTATNLTNERGKYAMGAVWIGPNANTNTVSYVDGIITNPVSTIAAAKTIADALLLRRFYAVRTGTTQIGADMVGYDFDGSWWSCTTTGGSRDVGTSYFHHASIAGGTYASTSGVIYWEDCEFMAAATVGQSIMQRCIFENTLTLSATGDYEFIDCASAVPGTTAPTLDVNSVANVTISFRRWSGGLTIANLAATTVVSIDVVSGGTITLTGSSGATVHVRGMVAAITNTAGCTLIRTAVLNQTEIATPTNITGGTITTVGTVNALAANTVTASALATDAVTEIVTGVLTTQMTEAYRADGAAPTLAQAACETLAHLGEAAIAGTTKTLKRFDGTTTAETFTLDSATTPTSITRAT